MTGVSVLPVRSDIRGWMSGISRIRMGIAPECIASDGVSLVENPGGIYGFYQMLQTLAGDDPEEKKSMKEWAKGLGWTGRISEPKNML